MRRSARTSYTTGALDTSPGISVHGTGDVRAKPNVIELQMRSTGKAELTATP